MSFFLSIQYLLLTLVISPIITLFAAPIPIASTIGTDQCYDPNDLSWNPVDIANRIVDEDHQNDKDGYPCPASSQTLNQAVVEGSGAAIGVLGLKLSADLLKSHNVDSHPGMETAEYATNIFREAKPLPHTSSMTKEFETSGEQLLKSLSQPSSTKLLTEEMAPGLDSQAVKTLTSESIKDIPDSVITNMKLVTLAKIEPDIAAKLSESAQTALHEAFRSPNTALHKALWDFFKGNDFNTANEVKSLPSWLWEIVENGIISGPK
ncbi:MAG: hypothetical protein M1829_000623 [Trizodia sp. TS-e1964]|nr:MAG: hypothetical protein M1829_000623 [Trizodia sp. TS-e1964]